MKRILLIHLALGVTMLSLFFGLGKIDQARLEKASAKHHPTLLFAHQKLLISDGGSIYWSSLIYDANEHRRMRVWEKDGKTQVADGFQGTSWTWNYHNLVWLGLIVASSFIGSMVTRLRKRATK